MNDLEPSVQVAIVGGISTIVLTVLGGIGWAIRQLHHMRKHTASMKKDAKETLYQVKNDHTHVNLRDDVDRKHEAVMHEIATLNNRMNGHLDRFNTMDKRDARIEDMLGHLLTERITHHE